MPSRGPQILTDAIVLKYPTLCREYSFRNISSHESYVFKLYTRLEYSSYIFFHSETSNVLVYVLVVYSFRDDRRWTPLLYVAAKGCPCCTKVLVEYGAKINEWDKNRVSNYTSVAVLWRSYCAKDLFTSVRWIDM